MCAPRVASYHRVHHAVTGVPGTAQRRTENRSVKIRFIRFIRGSLNVFFPAAPFRSIAALPVAM
jgi:hypothetical protein